MVHACESDASITACSSILEALHRHAIERPEQRALVFIDAEGHEEAAATFAQAYADTRTAAWAWRQQAVQPGDVVLLAMNHSYDLAVGFLGALYAGAVPVILPYPRVTPHPAYIQQLAAVARHTGATAVFGTQAVTETAQDARSALGCRAHTFTLPQAALPPPDFAAHVRGADRPLYLQLTSGTTGAPKLAILSQQAVMMNIWRVYGARYRTAAPVVGCMPFSHDGGLVLCLLIPLVMGQLSVHLSPAHWTARPELLWDAVTAYRSAVTFLPNFALNFMVQRIPQPQPQAHDLSSLHTVIVAAELVLQGSLQRFHRHFSACGLRAEALCGAYGMAEQVVGVSFCRWGQPTPIDWIAHGLLQAEKRAVPAGDTAADVYGVVSCGVPLPGIEVLIADEMAVELPNRHIGEVRLRSDHGFSGYFRRTDLNGQVLADGWYCTGDLGYLAGGELFILGRKDDLIIVGGRNIQPQAIEEVATDVLAARGRLAVAFGLRDAALGTQAPVLICETRAVEPAEQLAAWRSEIHRLAQERLEVALTDIRFVPKGWVIQSDAKVGRAANRDKYLAEFSAPRSDSSEQAQAGRAVCPTLTTPFVTPRTELEQQIADIWAALLGLDAVGVEDNFFELGGDSLLAMRMLLHVEGFIGQADATAFFQRHTVASLAGTVATAADQSMGKPDPVGVEAVKSTPRRRSWRVSADRRLRKFMAQGPVWGSHSVPYGLGIRLQRALVTQPWLRRRLYARQLESLRRWQVELGAPQDEQALIISLLANTWLDWRRYALRQRGILDCWVTFHGEGWQLFEQPNLSCGMVVALPHVAEMIAPLQQAAQLRGWETEKVINDQAIRHTVDRATRSLLQTQSRTAQLWQAQQVLRRKGVVFIAGDGRHGRQSVEAPFWGRLRPFQIGAAELAITTGSALVPAFSMLDVKGHMQIEVMAPLIPQPGAQHEQISALTRRYAALYAAHWPHLYASMYWPHLAYNLALPPP